MNNTYRIALFTAPLICLILIGLFSLNKARQAEPQPIAQTPAPIVPNTDLLRGQTDQPSAEEPTESEDINAIVNRWTAPDQPAQPPAPKPAETPSLTLGSTTPRLLARTQTAPIATGDNFNKSQIGSVGKSQVGSIGAPSKKGDKKDLLKAINDALEKNEKLRASLPEKKTEKKAKTTSKESRRVTLPTQYEMRKNDTIVKLATKYYGNEKHILDILNANPKLDFEKLGAGTVITLPKISGVSTIEIEKPVVTLANKSVKPAVEEPIAVAESLDAIDSLTKPRTTVAQANPKPAPALARTTSTLPDNPVIKDTPPAKPEPKKPIKTTVIPKPAPKPEPVIKKPVVVKPVSTNAITHKIKSGDRLWTLAKKFYGHGTKWTVIYNVNKDVIGSNPNRLPVGKTLRIPGPTKN